MKFDIIFENMMSELEENKKWASKVNVKSGKMTRILDIPEGKTVSDVYKSGKKLAKDLVKACGGDQKKAAGMLAFAANVSSKKDVFDSALKALKSF